MKRLSFLVGIITLVCIMPRCEKFDVDPITKITTSNASPGLGRIQATGKIMELSDKNHSEYGFCYGTMLNPLVADGNITIGSAKVGDFDGTIEGLEMGQQYYIRAFCKDGKSYIYGQSISATTYKLTVTTTDASNILGNTAVSGGNVTVQGTVTIAVKGICWNTAQNPTILNEHTENGSGIGTFIAPITGLNINTQYYLRAFAITSTDTIYGNQINFTTNSLIVPTVTTGAISKITNNSAECAAVVSSDGGIAVTSRGICWGTTDNPTISNNFTNCGTGTGAFSGNLAELSSNTTYHVRAFATNQVGTSYGTDVNFKTINPIDTIYSLVGTAFYKTDGTTLSDWDYDRDLIYENTENNVSTFKIAPLELITNGEFKIRTNHSWTSNYGFPDLTILGDMDNFFNSAGNIGVDTGKIYEIILSINWANNTRSLQLNNLSGLITTSPVSQITPTTVMCGGIIINEGTTVVTARGVCWSTNTIPTINDNYIENGVGSGTFSLKINGLSPNTKYYLRAFATNQAGTAYGEEIDFTTVDPALSIYSIIGSETAWTNDIDLAYTSTSGNVSTYTLNSRNFKQDELFKIRKNHEWLTSYEYSDLDIGGETVNIFNSDENIGVYSERLYQVNLSVDWDNNSNTLFMNNLTPSITTTTVNTITATSSTSGGNILNAGISAVTNRGVCWSLTSRPTISDGHTDNGSGVGTFTSSITDLTPSSTYYIRSYATNNEGTSYGREVPFNTISDIVLPTVTTSAITKISNYSSTCGGNVTNLGNGTVSAKGICWSTSSNPTISSDFTSDGNGIGDFTSNLEGLSANTTYYVKAYATNETGTGYGNEVSFKTTELLTDIDGNNYNTIKIGDQVWMQENLKTTKYRNNDPIELVTDNATWISTEMGAYCWFNDDISHKDTYGALYNNYITADSRLVCPTGWHVPTDGEFTILTDYLGGEAVAGGKLKSTTLWNTPNTDATNETGFYGVPAGFRDYSDGLYYFMGNLGLWWSNTESDATHAYSRYLSYNDAITNKQSTPKHNGLSIRCLKGEEEGFSTITTDSVNIITSTSAKVWGNFISDGGISITDAGFCWNTTSNPTITGEHSAGLLSVGVISNELIGLMPNTTYYIRAYATNSRGTAYGDVITFTTTIQVTDFDYNTYNTVQIGTQLWMQDNLRVTHYRNGDEIPLITDNTEWTLQTAGAYCNYNNDPASYITSYGRLYNFFTTINNKNLCPAGWHVPSDNEFKILEKYLGLSSSDADLIDWRGTAEGNKMKTTGNTYWITPSAGTNSSGYSGLPGGERLNTNGGFDHVNSFGTWWTSTPSNLGQGYIRALGAAYANINRNNGDEQHGYSVRCLQGEGETLPAIITTAASSITATAIICGGNVTSDGNSTVTVRGVCWNTATNPTIDLTTKTTDGSGIGSFTSSINSLNPGITYYYRAYATNSIGTAYGEEFIITTYTELPTLTTTAISNITSTNANSGGTISSDGGATITERGVCWSTIANPTISDYHTSDGTGSGSFTSELAGLLENTIYYVRAFATNSVGTAYGNEISFTTAVTSIGASYAGGIVFYIDGTGQHGFVCADVDQSAGAPWGCQGTAISGADGTAVGAGAQNTIDIENGCTTSGTAADICANLTRNGYSDWFLPSKDELNLMYINLHLNGIGNFASNWYLSSSEYAAYNVWEQSFSSGSQANWFGSLYNKATNRYVRAVRAF